jgi:hypothetical protein
MKREGIRELYIIGSDNGTLKLTKTDLDFLKYKGEYYGAPDIFVNPQITILDSGVLRVSGLRLSHVKVRVIKDYYWKPTPLTEMVDNWENKIFYEKGDIIQKKVITWSGTWPFRKRLTYDNVDHLKAGYYLSTDGYKDTQTTSNYRLIGFGDGQRGLIN